MTHRIPGRWLLERFTAEQVVAVGLMGAGFDWRAGGFTRPEKTPTGFLQAFATYILTGRIRGK